MASNEVEAHFGNLFDMKIDPLKFIPNYCTIQYQKRALVDQNGLSLL
jgi:hypothetical protein